MPNERGMQLPVPATLDDITPGWLTAALRAGGIVPLNSEVTAIRTEVIGEDRGFTGTVARLWPSYAGAARTEESASIIAKLPMAERTIAPSYRTRQQHDPAATRQYFARCAREARFYREIAPAGSVPAPLCWFSAVDEENQRVVLLLEDLAAAQPGDVLAGGSPAQIASVLEAIAPFHARWWTNPEVIQLAWLPPWIGDHAERQARYRQRIGPFLVRYGTDLPAWLVATVERLGDRYAEVLAALNRAPATIIHADLHLDNVMFPDSPKPHAAVILDWQSVARGPAAIDVAPFIAGSLPVVNQGESELLLRHYHQLLISHGIGDYAWEHFRDDCRLALLRQLAGIVGWLAQVEPTTLSGREAALVAAALGDGRLIAALLASDASALLHG